MRRRRRGEGEAKLIKVEGRRRGGGGRGVGEEEGESRRRRCLQQLTSTLFAASIDRDGSVRRSVAGAARVGNQSFPRTAALLY